MSDPTQTQTLPPEQGGTAAPAAGGAAPTPAPPALHAGQLVTYTYADPNAGDVTTYGLVLAVVNPTHPNPDGSVFDEGPHAVVVWLRDLSHPLPVELLAAVEQD